MEYLIEAIQCFLIGFLLVYVYVNGQEWTRTFTHINAMVDKINELQERIIKLEAQK